ncbi:unhealthy ribosome biogenesis protein 2 homolog isoform X1 [Petromyzon marinus]|uniref:unhealthy ribosome biogenesis protein 2 homolog isoform X1 n=2 Tax=Petromyzon marinus TaxID=7757 RepID=UPI003F725B15
MTTKANAREMRSPGAAEQAMASAGVYATIPATLKGSRTPWPEKLKLARAAWSSLRCLLPNKEQLLLDWACNSLSSYYSRKLLLDPGVTAQLWAFLGEALGSARVRGEGRPVSLRAPVAQMLVERLCELAGLRAAEGAGAGVGGAELETPSAATLLACFHDILRTPPLRTILAAKLELLARLLRALLTMACRSLLPASREEGARGGAAPISSSDSPSVASILQVLSQTLALYAATQRQQVNAQRVFRLLTGQLLGPAIALRHLLLSEGGIAALGAAQQPPPTLPRDPADGEAHAGARAPVARDIRSRLEAAVAAALFHADLLPSYRDELLPPRPDAAGSKERHRKAPGKSSSGLAPLRTILNVVSSPGVPGWDGASAGDDVDPVPCGAVPLLYRQLLEAYGGSSDSAAMLCFRALRRMVAALGVEPGDAAAAAAAVAGEEEAEGTGAASNIEALGSRHTLLALDQLLGAVATADVYNVAVDRIQHGALQFAFYERLAAALLARPSPALPAWHRCLRSLLGLNHLILEPHLQALVSVAWLGPEPPEPRGRKARDALLCTLLATYAKLRQLAKPLGAAFSSLCRDGDGDGDGSPRGSPSRLVGAALGDKLSECLAELPAGQAADVWELALEAVGSRLPPPGAPARGGPRWARPLPSVALLLHAVLFRARSPDAAWPAPAVARATRLMEATLREALAPLLLLCHAEGGAGGETAPALEAALTLAHTWAELDLCFQLNCPRYRSPGRDAGAAGGAVAGGGAETTDDAGGDDGGFAANASVGTYDFRCLAPAVPARVWRGLTRPLRRSGGGGGASSRARFLLATLSVQKVRVLSLRRADTGSRGYVRSLRRAAHLAVRLTPWADGARQAPWDGEAASVDEASRAAAHWHLVLGHLPLLLPHLAPGDVQAVADAVTDAALASPDDEGAGDAGGATPRALAWALLRGPLLPELGAVQAAVVTALVARAAEALGAGDDAGREGAPPSSLLPALARRDLPWAAEASAAARKAAYVRPRRDDGEDDDAEDAPPARAVTWALLDEVARGMLGGAAAGAAPPRLPPAGLAALGRVLDVLAAQRLDAAPPGTAARCFLALFAVVSSLAPADEASLRLLTRCCRLLAALQRGRAGAAGAPRAASPAETLEALARPLLRAGACAASCGAAAEAEHRRAVRGLFRAALLAVAARPRGRRGGPLAVRAFAEFLLAQADGAGLRRAAPASGERRRRGSPPAPSSALLEMATAFCQAALADSAAARRRSYAAEPRRPLDAVAAAAAVVARGLLDADDSAGVDAADEKLELLVVPAAVLLEAELLAPGGAATEGLRHGAVYARVSERVVRRLRSYEGGEDARRRVASHAGFLRLLLRGAAGERGGGAAETMAPALFSALADLLAAPGVTREEFSALRPQLSALGAPLAAACGAERLRALLLELLGALSAQRLQGARTREAVSALRLCQLLALADLEGGPCDAFWGAAPRFLSAIVTVTREAPRWLAGDAHAPVLAALDCAATLLARGGNWDVAATTVTTTVTTVMTTAEEEEEEETPTESGLPPRSVGPHGPAALAMQAVLAAPLERLPPTRHHEMFHACHELLFAIMQMHPQVMLRAVPAFLGCFHKLLRSAMHEGRLRGDGDKGTGGGEAAELAVSCAQTAERLYVQVAARVQEFPALAGFMAAQFVQELQKVSLRADVRRPLAEGAYAVLDLCREQDARVVAATLPSHGLRELFRQLQADHHKHHKYLSPRALALEPDEE